MSTAVVASDRVSVPALGVEGSKEVAVVTPDVIEEPKTTESTSDIKSTDNLAPSAPVVGETATTPALEHAESAIPTESSSVVKPAAEETTPIPDSTVVKSALGEGSAVPVKDDVPVAVAPVEGAKDKDVKEVKSEKKDKIKKQEKKHAKKSLFSRLSGIFAFHPEHKTSSGTSSSALSDEEATKVSKHSSRALPATTVTPATPSKEETLIPKSDAHATSSVVPVAESSASVVPAKTDGSDDVVEAIGKLDLAEKKVAEPVVVKDLKTVTESEDVKETHIAPVEPAPVPAAKPLDIITPISEEKKDKTPPSSANKPKVQRRISARIGQFMEFGKKKTSPSTAAVAHDDKAKDGDSFASGSADVSGAAPAAASTGAAPLLGEPIKVEPMGDIMPVKEVKEEDSKPVVGI